MIRIFFQRKKCIGCGSCSEVASSRWKLNENDGKSDLIGSTKRKEMFIAIVGNDEFDENKEAEEICPVKIIRVENVTG